MPPAKVAVMLPLDWPGHPSFFASDRLIAVGWFKVVVWLVVQRFASFTVTVCDPAANPVNAKDEVAETNEPVSSWMV